MSDLTTPLTHNEAVARGLPTQALLDALIVRGVLHGERQLSAGPIPVYRTERRWVTSWEPTPPAKVHEGAPTRP